MKTLFWIMGGMVCVALVIWAMYAALTIGLSMYIAHTNMLRGEEVAKQQQEAEAQQIRKSIAATGENMNPSVAVKHDADELSGKLPSLFSDPEGYKTEDNWLATTISREIAEMAFMAAHPDAPLPELKVNALVDPEKPEVQVKIEGYSAATITSTLTPAFAWDADGYAALARQLLGTTTEAAPVPVTDSNDVLGHLLDLTGPRIAAEDVRISANLQQDPASWQDHEEAALILTAMAMREQAGSYADNRMFLNRATAQLAVALALRGNQTESWPGLIADAAIRTLSGRELDALAHLDKLNAQTDLPEAAKPWISALRVLAKQDWREAVVTPQSPLLLKIMWFQVVEQDLPNNVPAERLEQVVVQPVADPTVAPDQQKTNPETLITDWGRIAGQSPFYDEADDDIKNAEYKLDLEFHELDEILKTEGGAPFDLDHLATVFSEGETDTVSRDANGTTVVRVIGRQGFEAASLRHIFNGLIAKSRVPDPNQDTAQMENFFTKMDGLFKGVPGYELARLHLTYMMPDELQKNYESWVSDKKTWPVWAVPYRLAVGMPGYALLEAFYRNAVPFGTVYETDVESRYGFIQDMNPQTMPPFETPELEQIKKLPLQQFNAAILVYNNKYNAILQAMLPKGPLPLEQKLLKLDPDNYILVQDHVPNDHLMAVTKRFLDYNMNPVERIESLDAEHLSDADRIAMLRKHVALEPAFGFRAGVVLRSKGLDDEAAAMERKAFAVGDDPIGISNSVLPLVDYDLRHGINDEALKVAKYAGQTDSEMGLSVYCYALEKLGQLDEAEAAAKRDSDLYSDNSWLLNFQLRHPDRYPAIYAEELKQAFPDGLLHVKLSDFSGAPKGGDQIESDSDTLKGAGLQPGDVIVALDGYRVDSDAQYCFVRALTMDSNMDFIIWRAGNYAEVKAPVPGRRMMVDIHDYNPTEPGK